MLFSMPFHESKEGYIYVLISREGDSLICEVVDNGVGISGLSNGEAGLRLTEQPGKTVNAGCIRQAISSRASAYATCMTV